MSFSDTNKSLFLWGSISLSTVQIARPPDLPMISNDTQTTMTQDTRSTWAVRPA